MRLNVYLQGLLLLALLVGVGYALNGIFTEDLINQFVVGHGLHGELLFIGAGIFLTGLGVSRQLVSFFAGYAYGLMNGLELSLFISLGGSLVAYAFGYLFKHEVSLWRSGQKRCIERFAQRYPFYLILALRLSPIGSNLLVNVVAGAMHLRIKPFIAASAIGYLPQAFIFSLAGSGLEIDPVLRIGSGAMLFLATSFFGLYMYKSFVANKCPDLAPTI